MTNREIRWPVVAVATLLVVTCMSIALRRIRVESDLTSSIPAGSPVLESGRRLLTKHPLIDWVAIDISARDGSNDTERLVAAAVEVQRILAQSGQFASVGSSNWVEGVVALQADLVQRLPTLFSRDELETQIAPRLTEASIRAKLEDSYAKLGELEGLGQAEAISADPLGLRELVTARLKALFPEIAARVEHNHLVSADGKHLLLTAVPHHALGDPESSRRIAEVLRRAQDVLDERSSAQPSKGVVLVPTGAYRAAMDNEAIVKADTNRAVWLVTLVVSVLLLTCFSRPIFGLLTLLPATAGVAASLLLYSFFRPSMSALSLGFGAALISITVDQGIVYIAYLDRVRGATGKTAAKQTFSAVSLATLTTVGAFLALQFSGYRLLEELGIFAALGSAFSFAFVHAVFPLVFRAIAPTPRRPWLPVDRWLRWCATGSVGVRVAIAIVMAVGLGAFARPRFAVDLDRLNTVTHETRVAEAHVREIWGDLMSRAYVLLEARDPEELQSRCDDLVRLLARERIKGTTKSFFSPSQLWPGQSLAKEQHSNWRNFWNEQRREQVKRSIAVASKDLGFSSDAFDGFVRSLENADATSKPIPETAYSLLGLAKARDGNGWVWLAGIERGASYDAARFATAAGEAGFSVFDGTYFGRELNAFLGSAFQRMLLIVAPFVLLAVALSFQNLRLVLLVLFPVVFSLVATLGAFGILGHPIDIPGLMISVVVLGMGTNFSVYLVHSYQRSPDPTHPVQDSVRVAALLDGGATVLGMGVMAASTHVAARSAGLSGVFGIGFSLFGALVLLPPILTRVVRIGEPWGAGNQGSITDRVWARFRYLEPRPRWDARRRLARVPQLESLARLLDDTRRLLLIGCGYGTEAAWLLASNGALEIDAVEHDSDRRQIASLILADRGRLKDEVTAISGDAEPMFDAILILNPMQFGGLAAPGRLRELVHSTRSGTRVVLATNSSHREPLHDDLQAAGFVRSAISTADWEVWDRGGR